MRAGVGRSMGAVPMRTTGSANWCGWQGEGHNEEKDASDEFGFGDFHRLGLLCRFSVSDAAV
jgi:hypothetical protein